MELSLLLAADYASTTVDGKLYVMGIFNQINASAFPATHAEMYLITQFTAPPHEYGRNFKLGIKLLDEDAGDVLSLSADAVVPHSPTGRRVHLNNLLKLVNVVFPKPGVYEFSVLVDHDLKGTLAIDVLQTAGAGA